MNQIGKAVSFGVGTLDAAGDSSVRESQSQFIIDLQAGDQKAFELLVAQYERPIVRFLYRYLGNSEEAKEVCQDVFLKIFRGIPHFQNNCSLKTWIYRITLNAVLNEKRRWYHRLRDRFVGLDAVSRARWDSLPDPEMSLTLNERCRRVSIALKKMSPEHRAVLILRDLEGFSYQEVAASLGLALGTVKSRIARARKEMKDAIQDLL